MTPRICTVCMDDLGVPGEDINNNNNSKEESLYFACGGRPGGLEEETGEDILPLRCQYIVCFSCIRESFQADSAMAGGVENFHQCPMCQTPMARDMLLNMIGPGALQVLEDQLRPKVEQDIKAELKRREKGVSIMAQYTDRVDELFHELCELLNLKCPRCKAVFYDYDGCNALCCAKVECRAAFCAICLQDCGTDAHDHVRKSHGANNLFDKASFDKAKEKREVRIVKTFLEKISEKGNVDDSSFEVIQLLRNKIDRTLSIGKRDDPSKAGNGTQRSMAFLRKARKQLQTAVLNDRLGILREVEKRDFIGRGLGFEDVSPRCVIPEQYKLELFPCENGSFSVKLSEENGYGLDGEVHWKPLDLTIFDKASEAAKSNHHEEQTLARRQVDSLINIKQSLKCGVIAFMGSKTLYQSLPVPPAGRKTDTPPLAANEISVKMLPVGPDGAIMENPGPPDVRDRPQRVIAINQNQRFLLLERHVKDTDENILLFDALKDFLRAQNSKRVIEEIPIPAPESFGTLNAEQQRVAHPLSLRTAMEVAGPPGTGKTKTITELIRGLLDCTDVNVIVLSERNGAIDAIADKFCGACFGRTKNGINTIKDIDMWTSVVVFGSEAAMGPSAKRFTMESKIRDHPELVQLRQILEDKRRMQATRAEKMRKSIAEKLLTLSGLIPRMELQTIADQIKGGRGPGFETPLGIISLARSFLKDSARLLQSRNVGKDDFEQLAHTNDGLLGPLVKKDSDESVQTQMEKVTSVHNCISYLVTVNKNRLFDEDEALAAQKSLRDSEENLQAAVARIEKALIQDARVMMCTIGSSHKIPVLKVKVDDNNCDSDDESEVFASIRSLDVKTIAIFDEAGCIPSYELIGLTRLGRQIDAIVAVGDQHQLPPYNPQQSSAGRRKRFGSGKNPSRSKHVISKVESILEASGRNADDPCKIKLTVQYRVPRDIAEILNARIYRGDYNTIGGNDSCGVESNGFSLVHVPRDERREEQYVNRGEIEVCIDLVRQLLPKQDGRNIMVLTPYKKQQRELEFQFVKAGLRKDKRMSKGKQHDEIPILTIDQCQGQEADYVFLSLAQRPTSFLDKHRMNVALSRTRYRLFLLTDKADFRKASLDSQWECNLIAKDLLRLDAAKANNR